MGGEGGGSCKFASHHYRHLCLDGDGVWFWTGAVLSRRVERPSLLACGWEVVCSPGGSL
jgi:hypothetical protein